MLLKLGVDISRLKPQMRTALGVIEGCFQVHSIEAVVTSTFEGNHMPSSLHYGDLAVDVRLPPDKVRSSVMAQLIQRLGPKYDVVLEADHIHIEYDPKGVPQ